MSSLLHPLPTAAPSPPVLPSGTAGFGRRRFWTAAAAGCWCGGKEAVLRAKESVELLGIPGVGPRNLRKLVDGGVRDLARLKQLCTDKPVGGSAEKMVQFLQNSVGIIHKSHAESITSFVKDSVVGELKEEREVPVI
uniref:Uncharacterized protein n=1 Tax=Arundo donax TaxID=35708 RepID=A0A0A9E1A7_ARUDO